MCASLALALFSAHCAFTTTQLHPRQHLPLRALKACRVWHGQSAAAQTWYWATLCVFVSLGLAAHPPNFPLPLLVNLPPTSPYVLQKCAGDIPRGYESTPTATGNKQGRINELFVCDLAP